MNYVEVLSHKTIQITPARLNFLRDCSTMIALAVSIIMLLFYRYDKELQEEGNYLDRPVIPELAENVMSYLGFIQLATSISLLLGFIYTKSTLIISNKWRWFVDNEKLKAG